MEDLTATAVATVATVLIPTLLLYSWCCGMRQRWAQPGSRYWVEPAEAMRRAEEADRDDGGHGSATVATDWRRLAARNAAKLRDVDAGRAWGHR